MEEQKNNGIMNSAASMIIQTLIILCIKILAGMPDPAIIRLYLKTIILLLILIKIWILIMFKICQNISSQQKIHKLQSQNHQH